MSLACLLNPTTATQEQVLKMNLQLQQRLVESVDHFTSQPQMPCDYPNKIAWWTSLNEESIQSLSMQNPSTLIRAARDCLGVEEIGPQNMQQAAQVGGHPACNSSSAHR